MAIHTGLPEFAATLAIRIGRRHVILTRLESPLITVDKKWNAGPAPDLSYAIPILILVRMIDLAGKHRPQERPVGLDDERPDMRDEEEHEEARPERAERR